MGSPAGTACGGRSFLVDGVGELVALGVGEVDDGMARSTTSTAGTTASSISSRNDVGERTGAGASTAKGGPARRGVPATKNAGGGV